MASGSAITAPVYLFATDEGAAIRFERKSALRSIHPSLKWKLA
jgi:hypothetical protein